MSSRSSYQRNDSEYERAFRQRGKRDTRTSQENKFAGRSDGRYECRGNLSPLRSPLRPEPEVAGRRRPRRNDRNDSARRTRYPEKRQRTPDIGDQRDFPSLDKSRYTPEGRPSSASTRPGDWGSQVEQFEDNYEKEHEELDRYKRELMMNKDSSYSKEKLEIGEIETDEAALIRKQKAIDYGKNTIGYDRYTTKIPRGSREKGNPKTPNKFMKCSRRSWDMQICLWRKRLHEWDLPKSKRGRNLSEQSCFSTTESSTSELSLEDGINGMDLETRTSTSEGSISPSENRPRGDLEPTGLFSSSCDFLPQESFQQIPKTIVNPPLGNVTEQVVNSQRAARCYLTHVPTQLFPGPDQQSGVESGPRGQKAHYGVQRYERARSTSGDGKPSKLAKNDFFSDFVLDEFLTVDDNSQEL